MNYEKQGEVLQVLLTFSLLVWGYVVMAQTQIRGKVTDEQGLGLSGVTITEKGTNNAVSTGEGGTF